MTMDGAAEVLQVSRQKMWRIENGFGPVRPLDVRAMCALYGATPELTEALIGLASETRAKGWWHSYGDAVPEWFELYVGLEQAANRLREHDDTLIPGLLQTVGYALGVYQNRADMTKEKRDRLIEVRLQRQALLQRRLPAAPRFEVMLSEAVLLRVVGSPATMVDQLQHLIEMSRLPNVSIRILPMNAGLHFGAVAGAFVMLDFPLTNRIEPIRRSSTANRSPGRSTSTARRRSPSMRTSGRASIRWPSMRNNRGT